MDQIEYECIGRDACDVIVGVYLFVEDAIDGGMKEI